MTPILNVSKKTIISTEVFNNILVRSICFSRYMIMYRNIIGNRLIDTSNPTMLEEYTTSLISKVSTLYIPSIIGDEISTIDVITSNNKVIETKYLGLRTLLSHDNKAEFDIKILINAKITVLVKPIMMSLDVIAE